MKFQFIAAIIMAAEAAFFSFLTPSIKDLADAKLKEFNDFVSKKEPIGSDLQKNIYESLTSCLRWSVYLRRTTLTSFMLAVITIIVIGFFCQIGQINPKSLCCLKVPMLLIFFIYYSLKSIAWMWIKYLEHQAGRDFNNLLAFTDSNKLRKQ